VDVATDDFKPKWQNAIEFLEIRRQKRPIKLMEIDDVIEALEKDPNYN
jgi:hypothetical protein